MKILIPSLLTVLVATNAFSYTTKEECEKVEKLDCKECGGGWHRPAACPPSLLAYSGTLSMADKAVDGLYDVAFHLYHDPVGGVPAAVSSTNLSLTVVNGHLDAQIDTWGSDDLAAENLYVEVAVRPTGSDQPFAILSPRQAISIVPKASLAKIAETVLPTAFRDFPQEGMDGAIIARATLTGDKLAPGQVVKSLNGLTEAVTLKGGNGISIVTGPNNTLTLEKNIQAFNCTDYENCYWSLTGNVNIMAGANFLGGGIGELDPVEFRVNNTHAMRLVTANTSAGTPIIIGGHAANAVVGSANGGTIGGGGLPSAPNKLSGALTTVSGGAGNFASKGYASIGGGAGNLASGAASRIGGGIDNRATLDYATVSGGHDNANDALDATIGGGGLNKIQAGSTSASLVGGQNNVIEKAAAFGTLGGGENNTIKTKATHGTLGGGKGNIIYDVALFASLVGGEGNVVGDNTSHGSILGGHQNALFANTHGATIAGGQGNKAESDYTAVAGGMDNYAIGTASSIPGGLQAVASNYGQQAYASGQFNAPGDAQSSLFVVRNTTSSATPTDLFLDGSGQSMTVPPDTTWTFKASVVARTSGATALPAGWEITGVVNRIGTAPATITCTTVNYSCPQPGWSVTAVVVGSNLRIRATGPTGTTIRWVASVRSSEVTFP